RGPLGDAFERGADAWNKAPKASEHIHGEHRRGGNADENAGSMEAKVRHCAQNFEHRCCE
ncbi:MAG: hypothetical protein AAB250_19125, partial [Bdellovibrionota bacterium]